MNFLAPVWHHDERSRTPARSAPVRIIATEDRGWSDENLEPQAPACSVQRFKPGKTLKQPAYASQCSIRRARAALC